MQQSDLDILIEHLEKEVEYLKTSMDQCAAEFDFDGAKAFLTPYRETIRKLRTAKSLKDSNYLKKKTLKARIERELPRVPSQSFSEYMKKIGRYEEYQKYLTEQYLERKRKHLQELENLESLPLSNRLDGDAVSECIYKLQIGEIQYMKLEQDADHGLALMCTIEEELSLKIVANGVANIEGYLVPSARKAMKELGFSSENYILNISDFRSIHTYQILQTISIIFFDVFRAYEGKPGRMIVG